MKKKTRAFVGGLVLGLAIGLSVTAYVYVNLEADKDSVQGAYDALYNYWNPRPNPDTITELVTHEIEYRHHHGRHFAH